MKKVLTALFFLLSGVVYAKDCMDAQTFDKVVQEYELQILTSMETEKEGVLAIFINDEGKGILISTDGYNYCVLTGGKVRFRIPEESNKEVL